jgi:hypothetical protein
MFNRELRDSLLKKALETVVGQIVVAFAASSLVTLAAGGIKYFGSNHAVPGWVVFAGTILLTALGLHAIGQRRRIKALSPTFVQETYRLFGLEWQLTPIFFYNYQSTFVGPRTDPGFVTSIILGPVCPECKRDAADSVSTGDTCRSCGCVWTVWRDKAVRSAEHLTDLEYIEVLKLRVYVEAQAAARRGDLKQR